MAQAPFDVDRTDTPDDDPPPGAVPGDLASKRIVVRPTSARPGTKVTVWTDIRCGTSNASNDAGLYFGDAFVRAIDARSNAEPRSETLQIPQTPIRGPSRISVSCGDEPNPEDVDGTAVFGADFTVTAPALTLSADRAAPGDRLRAVGAGFTGCADPIDDAPAELALRQGDRVLARFPVARDGRVDAELTVPSGLPAGVAELTAACASERFDGSVRLALSVTPTAKTDGGGERAVGRTVPAAADRAESAVRLPSPGDLLDHRAPLAVAGAGTVLALPLVGFAAELFNQTLAENRLRIRRRLRPGAARPRSLPRAPRLQAVAFVALSAAFTVVVEPDAGLDRSTLALALSLVIAVPLTVLAYSGVAEHYRRRVSRVRAFAHLIPGALVVAVALGVISRSAHLIPGYVYGLFLAFTHAGLRRLPPREDGRAGALGAWSLAGLGLAAWVWRIPVEHVLAGDEHPAFGWILTENVLTQVYIAAVVGLVFGLLPIRFMDGHVLWTWSRSGWAAVYAVAVFLFMLTLLDPTGVATGATEGMWLRSGSVFGAFLLASVAFWAVFRLRPARGPNHPPPSPSPTPSSSTPPPMPRVPPTIGRP
nr:FGLLP motif-containing membrane protein [Streptomyces sp. SID3343]